MTTLQERLKYLREQNNIKQKQLAELLGVSVRAIGYYESGQRNLDYKQIIALASFFGVSTDYLLGITDIPRPIPANLQEIISQAADPAELLQALERITPKDNRQPDNKIDALIKGLDEESMRELRKYITFLHARQILDDGEDESSARSEVLSKGK